MIGSWRASICSMQVLILSVLKVVTSWHVHGGISGPVPAPRDRTWHSRHHSSTWSNIWYYLVYHTLESTYITERYWILSISSWSLIPLRVLAKTRIWRPLRRAMQPEIVSGGLGNRRKPHYSAIYVCRNSRRCRFGQLVADFALQKMPWTPWTSSPT